MSDEHFNRRVRGLVSARYAIPLFYRKRTTATGDTEEISVGPSVVCALRWIIVVFVLIVLLVCGLSRSALWLALKL